MIPYLMLAGVIVFAVVADILDVSATNKGIKAGVALESNTFLVGSKPSAKALYLRDILLLMVPVAIASFIFVDSIPSALPWVAYFGALGGRHVQGYFRWKKLFK